MQDFVISTDKDEYRQFCSTERGISIYMQPRFLDGAISSGQEWRVSLVHGEDGKIVAAFPYGYERRHGMWYITNPWQCARMGIYFCSYREYKSAEDRLLEHEAIVNAILASLPRFDHFCISFSGEYKNWQPFYWQGFSCSPQYSLVIRPNSFEHGWKPTKQRVKRVRRGKKRYVRVELGLEEYWTFLTNSYKTKGRTLHYTKETWFRLMKNLVLHDDYEIYAVAPAEEDSTDIYRQSVCSALIILKDDTRSYHQFGSQLNNVMDATSFLIYTAIHDTLTEGRIFDFEGSMIRGVCEFDASWNPEWEQYYVLTKNSRKYEILRNGCQMVKSLLRS